LDKHVQIIYNSDIIYIYVSAIVVEQTNT